MATPCDPQGRCPQCGYQNGAGAGRCVRCRTLLAVPQGCTGACAKCLLDSVRLQPLTQGREELLAERDSPSQR